MSNYSSPTPILRSRFLDIADTGHDLEITKANIANARKAYDDICQRRKSVTMSSEDARNLQEKLDRIRENLRFFGASVWRIHKGRFRPGLNTYW